MLFNSYEFIFAFLPAVLGICFLLAHYAGRNAAQLWLVAASLFFYSAWNVAYLPLLLGSIIFNFLIAVLMTRSDNQTVRQYLLWIAIIVDLGLLGYYKYSNFFLSTVNNLTDAHFRIETFLLPLGISFYTFQQLTLLVDYSAGNIKQIKLKDFVLFITFFPHLIAGPIVHHREMMPQFETASYRFDWRNLAVGVALFVAGLFKKVILADGIAQYVSPIYADAALGHHVTFFYSWCGAIGFMLQIYFDFSGYSEMALGLARMLGIKLPMNFNSPLKAVSIIDFWIRWHITLTRFLTAYIYNPLVMALTRSRIAKGKPIMAGSKTSFGAFFNLVAVPIMITMFCSGLWHGANWTFIAWGLLHGTYLVINHCWRTFRPKFWRDAASYSRVMVPLGFVLTFCSVMVAIPLFRAETFHGAADIIEGMVGLHGIVMPDAIPHRFPGIAHFIAALGISFAPLSFTLFAKTIFWVAALLFIALVPPNILEIMRAFEPAITRPGTTSLGRISLWPQLATRIEWRPSLTWAVSLSAITAVDLLALNRVSEFLYWKF